MPKLIDMTGEKLELNNILKNPKVNHVYKSKLKEADRHKNWKEARQIARTKRRNKNNERISMLPLLKRQRREMSKQKQKRLAEERLYQRYVKRGVEKFGKFEISRCTFLSLIYKNCHYCGAIPKIKYTYGIIYNSLDRINNKLGYYKENVVPCCWECNKRKGARTKKEFLDWIERVHNHTKLEVANVA